MACRSTKKKDANLKEHTPSKKKENEETDVKITVSDPEGKQIAHEPPPIVEQQEKRRGSSSSQDEPSETKQDSTVGNPSSAKRQGSDTPRRPSSALSRIKLKGTTVENVVKEYSAFPKYAISGYKVVRATKIPEMNIQREVQGSIKQSEGFYKQLLNLNILIKCDGGQVKLSTTENKTESLAEVCRMISTEATLGDHVTSFFLKAAEEAEKLLHQHLGGDKIELDKQIGENKFSFTGSVDYFCSGKDRLESKYQHVLLFKIANEKFVLSRDILELFLYAAAMDIPTAYILSLHLKDANVVLYEFRFKFDKLREYNKGTTVKNICENFFKNTYSHNDCKMVFKDSKDFEASKKM